LKTLPEIFQIRVHIIHIIFIAGMVDADEDDFEIHTRTSPRFTCKKPAGKKQLEEVLSDSSSEDRPRKKMKTQPKLNPKKGNDKQVCLPCNFGIVFSQYSLDVVY
jgi:hypothetical protein